MYSAVAVEAYSFSILAHNAPFIPAPGPVRFDLFAFPLYLLYNVLLDTAAEETAVAVLCKPAIHHNGPTVEKGRAVKLKKQRI